MSDTKQIAYIVTEATFLRYFFPLALEANKRDYKSIFFIHANGKYNNPCSNKNYNSYITDCTKHHIDVEALQNVNEKRYDITFVVEGCGIGYLNKEHNIVSVTYCTDFVSSYDKYIDTVKYVVFQSKYIAEFYNKVSNKNLYLGSPKFDVVFTQEEILRKYNLDEAKKYVLVLYPRSRDVANANILEVYKHLHDISYNILVKTRGKDPISDKAHRGDFYFVDESWWPHTTMELIKISDFVINYGSTAIEECVILRTPVINFSIKPFEQPLGFLYAHENVCNLESAKNITLETISKCSEAMSKIPDTVYDNVISKYLTQSDSYSRDILDALELI